MISFSAKDPNDVDDFTWEWAAVLAMDETISTFDTDVVAGGVTVDDTAISGTMTTARISGGTAGTMAQVRGRITTSTGRILDETATFQIREH